MTDEPMEVEAKFVVDGEGRSRLAELKTVGAFTVVSRDALEQDDLYFDTHDAVLAAVGATLRVRRNQKGVFMTFKGRRADATAADEAHIASRLEDEVPLPPEYASRVTATASLPDDLSLSPLIRARASSGDAELVPTVRLHNERLVIELSDDGGHHLELAIDRCRATRISDGRVVEFEEVELEAKSADRDVLRQLAETLRACVPSLSPSHLTKLERALR